ncbi:small cell adhesion glycoprotein homolog [Solea solea]|uniref:small cell adhesion glycoprotein homolog n=1 Tax=Solea solea TaxID=90069 RepID=UPI00272BA8E1|nr:small cell adhesion glycoprotein homolog [Solea solea]
MNPSPGAWSLSGPHLTSSPAGETQTPHPPTVTNDFANISSGDGDLAALIGGIVGCLLLVLTCVIVVLLWCLSRHKGSYITNEMDEDNEMVRDGEDDDEDDESLQLKQPLKSKEDER